MTYCTRNRTANSIFENYDELLQQLNGTDDTVDKIIQFLAIHKKVLDSGICDEIKYDLKGILIDQYLKVGHLDKADSELEDFPHKSISYPLLKRNFYVQKAKKAKSSKEFKDCFSKALNYYDIAFNMKPQDTNVVDYLVWAVENLFQISLHSSSGKEFDKAQANKYLNEAKKYSHWDAKQARIISCCEKYFNRGKNGKRKKR